jgi:DNA-binding winged helix-turn-helix (wHTH) protein/tetratricopeptide (TPR) repeat protein
VDLVHRLVLTDGQTVKLTPKEAALLAYLAERPGKTITREQLLRDVWGYRGAIKSRTVDTTVRTLRSKVECSRGRPTHILTEHGVGYRFKAYTPRVTPEPEIPAAAIETGPGLMGRSEVLGSLFGAFVRGVRVVSLWGMPGVGTTSVAQSLAEDLTVGSRRALWIDVGSCHSLADVVEVIGQHLGCWSLDAPRPCDAEVRVRAALASGGRLVVMLDHIDAVMTPVSGLVERLVLSARDVSFVLVGKAAASVTSAYVVHLAPLSDLQIEQLLRRAAPERTREDAAVVRKLAVQLEGIAGSVDILVDALSRSDGAELETLSGRGLGRVLGFAWASLEASDRESLVMWAHLSVGISADLAAGLGLPHDTTARLNHLGWAGWLQGDADGLWWVPRSIAAWIREHHPESTYGPSLLRWMSGQLSDSDDLRGLEPGALVGLAHAPVLEQPALWWAALNAATEHGANNLTWRLGAMLAAGELPVSPMRRREAASRCRTDGQDEQIELACTGLRATVALRSGEVAEIQAALSEVNALMAHPGLESVRAELSWRLGHVDRARAILDDALKSTKDERRLGLLIRARGRLTWRGVLRGDLPIESCVDAAHDLEQALEVFVEPLDMAARVEVLLDRGAMELFRGAFPAARYALRAACRLAKERGWPRWEATGLGLLALCSDGTEDVELPHVLLRTALERQQPLGDTVAYVGIRLRLAAEGFDRGDFGLAAEHLRDAERMSQLDDGACQARRVAWMTALGALAEGKAEEAFRQLQRSHGESVDGVAPHWEVQSVHACVLAELGRVDEAADRLDAAEAALDERPEEIGSLICSLSRAHLRLAMALDDELSGASARYRVLADAIRRRLDHASAQLAQPGAQIRGFAARRVAQALRRVVSRF